MLGWKLKVILAVAVLFSWNTLGGCQVYSCPPVGEEMVGICAEECRTDRDCDTPLKCCSNGCGHTCTHPTLTPYHPPPYECPTPNEDIAGTCVEECSNDTMCSDGYQCCSNGCGHTCVSICNLIELKLANQTLLGAYQPQCEDSGRFSEVQCHGSTGYCWCVNPVSGEPRSELMRGVDIQCNCSYAGETYSVGEVFIADDGFNSCTCTVTGIHCTEHRVFHSCPAVREDEEAGICVAECTLDSECPPETKCCYTGCGYSCMTPEVLPYIPIPTMDTCPPTEQVPCAEGESCEESSEFACDEDTSLCCQNDCSSSVCVYRTGPTPCKDARKIVRERNSTHLGLVGGYSPQCDFDGHFKSIQCKEHYCWCVDRHTGTPESDKVAFENLDHLHCTNCVYQGHKYGHLEEFPAGDGCNTCTCVYDGAISCTELECDEPEPEDSNLWSWWHSVLIYCVVAVIVLTLLVLVLLVVVVVTMKKNKFRHRKLKEAATVHFESDMDSVYFKHGQDLNTVELKVPVEDVDNEPDHSKA